MPSIANRYDNQQTEWGKFAMLRPILIAGVAMLTAFPVYADDFYAGKTVTIVTSTGPGGSYDLMARLVAAHMPSHLPGAPTMIVQNMPGAGHVLATNYMYAIAPKDGTAIATVDNIIPLHQMLEGQGVHYDAGKFNWLGSTGPENSVAFTWAASGIKTVDDAKKREVILGATGAGSSTIIYATIMNNLLGTKFKIVTGYTTTATIAAAMERGEVEGTGSWHYSSIVAAKPDWLKDGKINLLIQLSLKRHPDVANVPTVLELAKNDDDRKVVELVFAQQQVGRPIFAPPGLPAGRTVALRAAFDAMMADKGVLDEADRQHLEINQPMPGVEIAALVARLHALPAPLVERAIGATQRPD